MKCALKLFALVVLFLPVSPYVIAATQAELPTVTMSSATSIQDDFAGDKSKVIYVAFLHSPALTKALETSFASAGYQVTTTPEAADIHYVFDGAYQAVRQLTGRVATRTAAQYFDNPSPPNPVRNKSSVMLFGLNPVAFLAGNALNVVGEKSTLSDKVNNVFGDPDGVCLYKCERWRYEQRAVLRVFRRVMRPEVQNAKVNAYIASSVNLELLPGALFEKTQQLMIASTALPLPAVFKAETTVTVVQPTPAAPTSAVPVESSPPVSSAESNSHDDSVKTSSVDSGQG